MAKKVANGTQPPPPTPKESMINFIKLLDEVKEMFPGREEVVDAIGIALITKTSAFFLSPPGTAKSAIIREIASRIDMSFFGIQMREDTKVEEIFGMWDISQLEKGRYVRKWSRGANAQLLYLNEAFKGSSSALNSMLGLINEREVDDEDGYRKCPLWSAFLDSNELPRDKTKLSAFFDRISLKVPVGYLSEEEEFNKLIQGPVTAPGDTTITFDEIRALHDVCKRVEPHEDYEVDLFSIKLSLLNKGISPSDRSWAVNCGLKDVKGEPRATPIKAMALMNKRLVTKEGDFEILSKIFWDDPSQVRTIQKIILQTVSPMLSKFNDEYSAILDKLALLDSGTVNYIDHSSTAIDMCSALKDKITDQLAKGDDEELSKLRRMVIKTHSMIAKKVLSLRRS